MSLDHDSCTWSGDCHDWCPERYTICFVRGESFKYYAALHSSRFFIDWDSSSTKVSKLRIRADCIGVWTTSFTMMCLSTGAAWICKFRGQDCKAFLVLRTFQQLTAWYNTINSDSVHLFVALTRDGICLVFRSPRTGRSSDKDSYIDAVYPTSYLPDEDAT